MRASLFLILFTAASLTTARAQNFPQVPDNLQILNLTQVKNYWVNMMPEPREPNLLNRAYDSLIVDYHRQVGERHRFLQSIRAGNHDRYARIVMLKHNIQTYLLRGDAENVKKLRAELAAIEAEIAAEQAAQNEAQRAQDEVERIERLIAATNRLAEAIENNGGNLPRELVQEVQQIVPFEEECDIIPNLQQEIIGHRLPIIIDQGHGHPHVHGNTRRTHTNQPTGGRVNKLPQSRLQPQNNHQRHRTSIPSQPSVRQPSVKQPSMRQPSVRQPSVKQPSVKQPSVRQPSVRQPSVRPAQPAVKQQPAPRQPQPQVKQPSVRRAR